MTSNQPNTPEDESSIKQIEEDNDLLSDLSTTTSATTTDIPSFGWSEYAERVNGRFAMIGFIAILLIETVSHSGFLQWAGLIP